MFVDLNMVNTFKGFNQDKSIIDSFKYAAERFEHHGICCARQRQKMQLAFQTIQDIRDETILTELKRFIEARIGRGSYKAKAVEFAKERGVFLLFNHTNKVEFKFDNEVVFSVEVTSENGDWFCDVVRYYE